ncbi:MAG: methyltransferase domain-containing protein [Cucumibacter sp.]
MAIGIEELVSFYKSPLGRICRRLIRELVKELAAEHQGKRIVGLGFTPPYLMQFIDRAERVMAFMPARQGIVRWPEDEPCHAVMVDPLELPLTDAAVDLVIAVHGFEHVADAEELMRELWRVTAPGARLVIVVPRRRGLWAQRDNTPFGHGHPFSKVQLSRLLRDHSFTPEVWRDALYLPPTNLPLVINSARAFEVGGRFFGSALAGIMAVRARRENYPAVARRARASRLVALPEMGVPALPRSG